MSAISISATWDFSQLDELLEKIKSKITSKDTRKQIAQIMREDVLRQFQAGGVPLWQPLKDATIRGKRGAGYPRLNRLGKPVLKLLQLGKFAPSNVLIRSGDLLSSWTDETDPHHIEQIDSEDTIGVGSALGYAEFHQEGRGVPKRALTLTDSALQQIEELITEPLEEK